MIQSPRGYPMRRQDNGTSQGGRPLSASLWADEVGNDIAWAMDVRHQVVASWAARTSGQVRSAGDNEFGANAEGLTHNWRAETIVFPLHRLVDRRPSPIRVVCDIKSSDGAEVFVRGTLRPKNFDPIAMPGIGVADGWNHGIARTDSTSWSALPLESQYVEDTSPLRGFLQLPAGLWSLDTAVGGPLDRCCVCALDIWLGRMSDATTVSLGGYTVYAVAYGARRTSEA